MLRLSKLTDYAVVVLVRLDAGADVQTAPGIAATTGIDLNNAGAEHQHESEPDPRWAKLSEIKFD